MKNCFDLIIIASKKVRDFLLLENENEYKKFISKEYKNNKYINFILNKLIENDD